MPSTTPFLTAALLAGAAVPFQAGANAALGRLLGHPLWATLVSLTVSIALLVPVMLAFRLPFPAIGDALKAPWWVWAGGAAGVLYLTAALLLTPRLGAAGFIVAVIAGQIVASLAIDHFGLVGLPARPVAPMRLLGAALIIGGMVVTQWASQASAAAR